MTTPTKDIILKDIAACQTALLSTFDGKYPDSRDMANAMNIGTADWPLFFMTSRDTPKCAQIAKNPNCCLYYFNSVNRHAVRLYGEMIFDTNMETRHKYWRPEYGKFGYRGPDDADFVLMRFMPHAYKYYIGMEIQTGTL